MAPRLTPENRQHILQRHRENVPLRQIAREIGRPDMTVRRVLESEGVSFGEPKTTNRRSSPETEAHVLRLYDQGLSWAEINKRAGVTSVTVSKILSRNGHDPDRKPEGTEGKAEVITALYDAGRSTREIGQMLGHSKSTINAVVASNGGKLRKIEGCENPDFFDVIDTPEKAYWLGFISADGCIVTTARHPEGDHLAVQLSAKDRGHLLKLKAALAANAGVHTRAVEGSSRRLTSLSVGSRRLTGALLALGITPRKSATLQPWSGPEHLMPHYWRGMVDGDGSLARKGDGIYTVFLCGSEAVVQAFTEWAGEVCGTKAKPYIHSNIWYIAVSGRHQVPKLVRALYEDAPVSLDRKQEIADRILEAALGGAQ